MARRTISEHAGRVDPVISMGQRAYDLAVRFWPQLATVFTGAAMSGLAYLTAVVRTLGPIGVGGIGLFSALIAWIFFTLIQLMRIKRARIGAEVSALRKWSSDVSGINPLDDEFRRLRILISDLAHPITSRIENKRFADCELVGPANIVLHSGSVGSSAFNNCDFVVMKELAFIQNAIVFINIDIYRCSFWKCTIYIPKVAIPQFSRSDANFVSLTGDAEVDARPPNIPQVPTL